jgi:DNA-binding HxlR family transcriptional regulator
MPGRTPRRRYKEGCIAAHALEVLGDRWVLLVIRELLLGPKRFSLIRSGLPGISANVLAQRLGELEAEGLIARKLLPPPSDISVYELTDLGQQVRPVIRSLCRFGVRLPGHDPTRHISPTALMLSMEEMFARNTADSFEVCFEFGSEKFTATAGPSGFFPSRIGPPESALMFRGTTNAVAAAIYGPRPLATAVSDGSVGFRGDLTKGQKFVDLFSLLPNSTQR